MRALIILALVLQPLMGLVRGAPCCDSGARVSACCAEIAHVVCASAKAEPACCAGDACDQPPSGGPRSGAAHRADASCDPCRIACRPEDAPRTMLVRSAFRARHADASHRARLRVEIGRLREAMRPLAAVRATRHGFVLRPHAASDVAVLAPPVEGEHAELLALLGDGEAWSSSALALALNVSPRTVQRALEELARDGKADAFGRGRACRWIASTVPGFPTSLLLPASGISG
ncbi:HTH domain-containing protein [Leptolyngbya sp. 15MV]|nr:HTH domain-containing protein [Leptolyngbya sp. 15MV]